MLEDHCSNLRRRLKKRQWGSEKKLWSESEKNAWRVHGHGGEGEGEGEEAEDKYEKI